MDRVDRTRPALPDHGAIVIIGGVRVRVRRNWGHERGPTPVFWDVLDGDRVARTFLSRPSASDCQSALTQSQPPVGPKQHNAVPGVVRRRRTT